jgi:hypothetical protein
VQSRLSDFLPPDFGDALLVRRTALIVGLAALTAGAAILSRRSKWVAATGTAVVITCAVFSIPALGRVVNYPNLHTAELAQFVAWAKATTPADAVFHFADFGRDTQPGAFRARALRAVYVDWKAGGQVNYHRAFAEEWWNRWSKHMATFDRGARPNYAAMGIDYVVLRPNHKWKERKPIFENSRFVVYPTK